MHIPQGNYPKNTQEKIDQYHNSITNHKKIKNQVRLIILISGIALAIFLCYIRPFSSFSIDGIKGNKSFFAVLFYPWLDLFN